MTYSVLTLADIKNTIRAWIVEHQQRGHIAWQQGMSLNELELKLLVDKGGDHITMVLACADMLKGDSPDNVLTIGICTGQSLMEELSNPCEW